MKLIRWTLGFLMAGLMGCGGAEPAQSPGEAEETVSLALDKRVLGPGEELFFCQQFANPFGEDAEIEQWESVMGEGSHHLLVFGKEGVTSTPGAECGMVELASILYDAQSAKGSQRYPEGVAALLPKNMGLELNGHFLNTTDHDVEISADVLMRLAKPGTVKHHAGALMAGSSLIDIAPLAEGSVTGTCKAPFDLNITALRPHMHKWGIDFRVNANGKEVYQAGSSYEAEPGHYDPGIPIKAGEAFTVTCTYKNTNATPLGFSFSAADGEMCAVFGSFYPVPEGQSPFLFCGSDAAP